MRNPKKNIQIIKNNTPIYIKVVKLYQNKRE